MSSYESDSEMHSAIARRVNRDRQALGRMGSERRAHWQRKADAWEAGLAWEARATAPAPAPMIRDISKALAVWHGRYMAAKAGETGKAG